MQFYYLVNQRALSVDQQRTEYELDALGDLFLTETEATTDSTLPDGKGIARERQTTSRQRVSPGNVGGSVTFSGGTGGTGGAGGTGGVVTVEVTEETYSGELPGTMPGALPEGRTDALWEGPPPVRLAPKLPTIPQPHAADATTYSQTIAPALQLARENVSPLAVPVPPDEVAPRAALKTDIPTHPTPQQIASEIRQSLQTPPPQPSTTPTRVEAVFLGNLPGFASPWMTQYANHLANECGLVGILHIDDEQIDLDIVSRSDRRSDLMAMREKLNSSTADGIIAQLRAIQAPPQTSPQIAMAQLAQSPYLIKAWLIHMDTPLSDSLAQIARDAGTWTLISGIDEAAGEAALRWLGQILDETQIEHPECVQMMAMGSDVDPAVAMVRQLDTRADTAYDLTVNLVGVQKQMMPVHLQAMGSFELDMDQWPSLFTLLTDQPYLPIAPPQESPPPEVTPEVASEILSETAPETMPQAAVETVQEIPSATTAPVVEEILEDTPVAPIANDAQPHVVPSTVAAFVERLKHEEAKKK